MDKESKTGKARISYWLLPSETNRRGLAGLISRLADQYDGQVFEPHVTVYSGSAGVAGEEVGRILAKVAKDCGDIRLQCTGLAFSDKYTKTCYLSFSPDPRLETMSGMLGSMSAGSDRYQFDPHLSLFYGRLTGRDREEIREMIELPETVCFAGIAAMSTGARIESASDVEEWRLVDALRL